MKNNFDLQNWINKIEHLPSAKLISFLTIISGIITFRINYIHAGWINPDSVIYLEAAKYFLSGDYQTALSIYNWPLYSLLIALISKITDTSVIFSAQTLSLVFFMTSCYCFLSCINLLNRKSNLSILVGAIILFGTSYIVGDVLPMLMRDQGYWAFYLLGIYTLLKFFDQPSWKLGALWQLSIILAILFRVEGVFSILLPSIFIACSKQSHSKQMAWLKANFIFLFSLFIIIFCSVFFDLSLLGRLQELSPQSVISSYSHKLIKHSDIMSKQVLGHYLQEYSLLILIFGLILVAVIKNIICAGIFNSIFFLKFLKDIKKISPQQLLLIIGISVCFVISLVIISKVFVLSSRYIIPLAFLIMMFSACEISNQLTKQNRNIIKNIILVILAINLITLMNNLWNKPSGFDFRFQASSWLKKYNQDNSPVYINDVRVAFFYNDPELLLKITKYRKNKNLFINPKIDLLDNYQYIMVFNTKQNNQLYQSIRRHPKQFRELKNFVNDNKEKQVTIFEKISNIN